MKGFPSEQSSWIQLHGPAANPQAPGISLYRAGQAYLVPHQVVVVGGRYEVAGPGPAPVVVHLHTSMLMGLRQELLAEN